ncbi:MAG: MlaC/ttg2D family ABC transporter substrate-binding protein [Cyclonatronaceae bacterium]
MKIFSLSFVLALLSIAFTANANTAAATSSVQEDVAAEVRTMLEDRDEEIKELLGPEGTDYSDEKRQELMDIINEVIDYRAMARHALQDKWEELSAEQRDEFVNVFSQVIRDQSLNSLDIYRAEVTYEDFEVDGQQVTAHTVARLDNVRTPVIYDMEKEDGEWVVKDMSIDNVSTANSYQRSFQRILQRRSYDALLSSLKRRAGISEDA